MIKTIAIASLLAVLLVTGIPSASSASQCGLLPATLAQQLTTSAPWYCPINGQIYAVWSQELPFVFAVLLLAFTIAGLIFMIGAAMKSDQVRNFGLGELYEAIASTLIVGFFLFICAVVFGLIPAITVGGINPYATAINLIMSTIGQAQQLYASMYQIVLVDSFYISPSVTLQILGVDYSNFIGDFIGPGSVTAYPLELLFILPATTLGQLVLDGTAALYSQYYILIFFSVTAIPVFLVPGVVFRAILPTRALGGMLIAIGIGFYLVMPSLFAIAYYFTSPTLLQGLANSAAQLNRWGAGTGAEQNALSPSSPLVLAVGQAQSALSSFWLLVLFYPALIIAITYAFITQIANFIGGASRSLSSARGLV